MSTMLEELRRWLAWGVAAPTRAVHGAIYRRALGEHVVLEATVKPAQDAAARQELVRALHRAAAAPEVEAVLLVLDGPPGGRAAIQDLRAAIRALDRADKATYAFLRHATDATLWIAAACERVFLVPMADVYLLGAGAELVFLGRALERLGVEAEVIAAGAYKSAGEMFTRSCPSPANLEALDGLLTDLHRQFVDDLAEGRGLSRDAIHGLMARAPLGGEEAVDAGLVDRLLYADQLDDWLEEHHGRRARRVKLEAWSRQMAVQERLSRWAQPSPAVVVLHLEGPIVEEGNGPKPRIRSRVVLPLLDDLRKDERVAAVVLHLNTPGGAVLPSDAIGRAVERLGREKPVVACYEDVAASGGVYLSAPVQEVWARPGTLTGSVGVVSLRLAFGGALRRLGIHHHRSERAPNATLFSPFEGYRPAQRARMEERVEVWYRGFVERVARGRGLTVDAIEPHCRGRVWTGRQGKERGLVDRIGGLEDAVRRAAVLAGVEDRFHRRAIVGHALSPLERALRDTLGERRLPGMQFGERLLLQLGGGPAVLERLDLLLELGEQPIALLPLASDR